MKPIVDALCWVAGLQLVVSVSWVLWAVANRRAWEKRHEQQETA